MTSAERHCPANKCALEFLRNEALAYNTRSARERVDRNDYKDARARAPQPRRGARQDSPVPVKPVCLRACVCL